VFQSGFEFRKIADFGFSSCRSFLLRVRDASFAFAKLPIFLSSRSQHWLRVRVGSIDLGGLSLLSLYVRARNLAFA